MRNCWSTALISYICLEPALAAVYFYKLHVEPAMAAVYFSIPIVLTIGDTSANNHSVYCIIHGFILTFSSESDLSRVTKSELDFSRISQINYNKL